MSRLVPPRQFDPAVPERMDRPGNDPALLAADLRVLEHINRLLGGHRIPLHCLPLLAPNLLTHATGFCTGPLTILDLGTGAADVPRQVVRWARQRGARIRIRAVDGNPEILAIARELTAGWLEIELEQQNLLDLPYRAGSFDIVLCSLTLHHFAEADAIAILRRIDDIAGIGYIVNDLRRNRIGIALAKLMAHTIVANPIARFDAPASCERAFTAAELRSLAERAGLKNFQVRRHFACRVALVGRK